MSVLKTLIKYVSIFRNTLYADLRVKLLSRSQMLEISDALITKPNDQST